MLYVKKIGLALVFLASLPSATAASVPLPVPGSDSYHAFLLKEWNPSQPSVVMMLDPFCPYCIRTLEQKERLKNYNVFLFWSPILGAPSEKRVKQILDCPRPAGSVVISAVIDRKSPSCSPGEGNQDLTRLNRTMTNAYQPQAVPAYFFGGRRISLNQLDRYVSAVGTISGSAAVDWERYEIFRVAQPSSNLGRVGVILPKNFKQWGWLLEEVKAAAQFEWHLVANFTGTPEKQFCDATGSCNKASGRALKNRREELLMLFGLPENTGLRFILNGKLLSTHQAGRVLGVVSVPD